MRKLLTISVLCLSALCASAQKVIDLAGEWQFRIDRDNKGEAEGWFKPDYRFDDKILLPASMLQRLKGDDISVNTKWVGSLYDSSYFFNPYMKKYRNPGKDMKLQFFLTPDKHYVGKAWYKRTIHIGQDEKNPMYVLYLERPHIVSEVWVNGIKHDVTHNSLCVPHIYNICRGVLKAGDNTIAICVNNDPETVKVGQDSHSVTDQTQGNWNGIVGKMELRPCNRIKACKVYADIDSKTARVHLNLRALGAKENATVTLRAEAFNTSASHSVEAKPVDITLADTGAVETDITLDMGDGMLLWDEFNPQLYRLHVDVKTKTGTSSTETVFGMRKIEIKDKMFYLNNRMIQLRGTVENCDFPNTGYAPMDVESWLKVFKRMKSFGLNHVRFHSYCPPEAAFIAADMTGFYIQPEGPSWPNHGVKLGRGEFIDTYLDAEVKAICDTYGNHPSFTFMAFGNEPAGNWVKWSGDKVEKFKKYDSRHLYPGFSVGGGWAWQPKSEFAVKAGARGLNEWEKKAPEATVNFRNNISLYNGKDMPNTPIDMPYVSHETGQWCAFPNFDEIGKYTGVNKAKNFEIFRDILNDNGMGSRAHDFMMASGKLQALCYKAEIERTLRTPHYAGFQLLSLNDYSGQGTALVGVTDVFFDDKGYITNDEFREFCSPIVPLARIPKFTYQNDETFKAAIEVNQFSDQDLKSVSIHASIYKSTGNQDDESVNGYGELLAENDLPAVDIPIGPNNDAGFVSFSLKDIKEPAKLTLELTIPGTDARNHWSFWVYPKADLSVTVHDLDNPSANGYAYANLFGVNDYGYRTHGKKYNKILNRKRLEAVNGSSNVKDGKRKGSLWIDGIYLTDSLDEQAQKVLKKGGKVLICAAGKVSYGKEVVQQFTPVFWNTSWFKMRPPHTTGILVEDKHSIFDLFPTDYHSDMQWWELVNRAQVMQFTDFPKDFQPLVQSIDTWFVSRKIGMLFEANVGKGKLVMTTMDINSALDKRCVARQMRLSILNYMRSDKFRPAWTIDKERIADLFTKVAGDVNMFTNDSPDELKPKLK
ncbi:MAG: beta-glucuronidase [Bacteroidaceae bacterium]|nr:beta-glucuronidase [Bacteroidaceae bacterium]